MCKSIIMEYTIHLKCGKTKRKVENITLSLSNIRGKGDRWTYDVSCVGSISAKESLDGNSAFHCVVLGLAYLRQSIRRHQRDNPELKYYFEFDGELDEHSIEDIFWTHDCVVKP